jgi:hypothetical protein
MARHRSGRPTSVLAAVGAAIGVLLTPTAFAAAPAPTEPSSIATESTLSDHDQARFRFGDRFGPIPSPTVASVSALRGGPGSWLT